MDLYSLWLEIGELCTEAFSVRGFRRFVFVVCTFKVSTGGEGLRRSGSSLVSEGEEFPFIDRVIWVILQKCTPG